MNTEASASKYEVIVIGAGVGGLTAASLLAKAGKRVLVVEREPRPGGYIRALVHGPYQFDTAARLIMGCAKESPFGPGLIYGLLDQLGAQDRPAFVKVQPFCTMHLPGSSFQLWSGRQAFVDSLRQVFPKELDELPRLLDLCNQIYRGFMAYLSSPWGMLKLPFRYPALIRYRNATMEDVLPTFIPDPRARAAVASLWPYLALPPGRASFLMWAIMMASYVEEGAFFCRGGLHRLADSLASALVSHGGELVLGSEVTKILVRDGAARGVKLASGQEVFAPVVLCNTDPRQAFRDMVDPGWLPDRYRAQLERPELSTQALDVSLVTDLDLPALGFGFETLVFYSWDMEEVSNATSKGDVGVFTLTVTTTVDPSLAPPGQHLVSSICARPPDAKPSRESTQADATRLLAEIAKLMPGLTDHLVLARTGDVPRGYLTQEFGPVYGWAMTPRQIGMGRLGRRTPVRGLVLVGQWTQPGPGVLTVAVSGIEAAKANL